MVQRAAFGGDWCYQWGHLTDDLGVGANRVGLFRASIRAS